jgi:crossover junction endodeoxyribonuclease RusA
MLLAIAAGFIRDDWREGSPHLRLTFHPPDKRKRDLDNMLASVKSGLDGVSDAMGVDDSRWSLTLRRGEPTPGGAVVIEVKLAGDAAAIPFKGEIS